MQGLRWRSKDVLVLVSEPGLVAIVLLLESPVIIKASICTLARSRYSSQRILKTQTPVNQVSSVLWLNHRLSSYWACEARHKRCLSSLSSIISLNKQTLCTAVCTYSRWLLHSLKEWKQRVVWKISTCWFSVVPKDFISPPVTLWHFSVEVISLVRNINGASTRSKTSCCCVHLLPSVSLKTSAVWVLLSCKTIIRPKCRISLIHLGLIMIWWLSGLLLVSLTAGFLGSSRFSEMGV